MKKKTLPKFTSSADDDISLEYDFTGGVRGKYARTLREEGYTIRVYHDDGTFTETRILGENTVVLDPDVREYFPNSRAVNRALRTLISIVPEKRRTATKKGSGQRRMKV
jgi:hypothetical protein